MGAVGPPPGSSLSASSRPVVTLPGAGRGCRGPEFHISRFGKALHFKNSFSSLLFKTEAQVTRSKGHRGSVRRERFVCVDGAEPALPEPGAPWPLTAAAPRPRTAAPKPRGRGLADAGGSLRPSFRRPVRSACLASAELRTRPSVAVTHTLCPLGAGARPSALQGLLPGNLHIALRCSCKMENPDYRPFTNQKVFR